MGGDYQRSAFRKWRTEPHGGYSGAGAARARAQSGHRGKGFQDRADATENRARARIQSPHAGTTRMVLDKYFGQPRWGGAGGSGLVQDEGRVEVRRAGIYFAAAFVSGAVQKNSSQGAD